MIYLRAHMDFLDLAKQRRSVHNYLSGSKISDEEFLRILEPVRYTPSGYNAQPWEFLLIREEENLKKLHTIALNQDQVLEAGNVVLVFGDRDFGTNQCEEILKTWREFRNLSDNKYQGLKSSLLKEREEAKKREMTIRNGALAVMMFLLSAEEQGWVTCPMMGFRQLDCKRTFDIPENMVPLMMITLGKLDPNKPEPPQLPRKTAKDMAHFETFKSER